MKKKEKLFCSFYSQSLNLRSSAFNAGYRKNSEQCALKLIEREDVKKEIKKQMKSNNAGNYSDIVQGLKRLAFGSVSDAVKLVFSEREKIDDEFIESLDLFNVSEIKFQKTGSIEMKFQDRLKALSLLSELEEKDESDSALPFYKALEKSAQQLKFEGDEDE